MYLPSCLSGMQSEKQYEIDIEQNYYGEVEVLQKIIVDINKNSKKENNSPMIVKAIIICAFLIVMTLIVIEIVRLFRVI